MPDRRPARYADPRDVADAVHDMPNEYLECRDLMHVWRPLSASRSKDRKTISRTLQCARCLGEREEELDAETGRRLHTPKYDMPEGYHIAGLGRIVGGSKDVLRLASTLRELENVSIATQKRTISRAAKRVPDPNAPKPEVEANVS